MILSLSTYLKKNEWLILKDITNFLMFFSSLKKLEMFGCQAITDKCLKSISTKCLGLEVLNIGRVHRISQDCLVQMVNSLQQLTSLNVTGLEMVRAVYLFHPFPSVNYSFFACVQFIILYMSKIDNLKM